MRFRLPADADSRAAVVVTALVMALFGAALTRIPPVAFPRAQTDEAITVEFLMRPRAAAKAPPLVRRQIAARPVPRPHLEGLTVETVRRPVAEARHDMPVAPIPSPGPLVLKLPPGWFPAGGRSRAAGNVEAFGHVERPSLEPPPRADFKVRDRSIAGQLASMTHGQICGELRGALRGASGTEAAVIVRTMQEHGCI